MKPRWRVLSVACLLLSFHPPVVAEDAASVTFTFDFPDSEPSHYSISISSDGRSTYSSDGKLSSQYEGDPFRLDFTISRATRTRIFDLAKRARYFAGDIDSGKKRLASTGSKTLSYKDAQRSTQASYNYSPLPPVQELTSLFQNISTTMEFGRRLEYYYRYQKLALDEELKRMEEMWKQHSLEEVGAVAPILQKIAGDPAVINVVRARAQRLAEAGTQ